MGTPKLESAIHTELEILVATIDQQNRQPFNFQHLISTAVCNLIMSLVFGQRYDHDDPTLRLFFRLLLENFENVPHLNNTVSAMPWLRFLPGDVFKYWQTLGNRRTIEAIFQEEINSHKRSYRPDVTRDFVDSFLHQMQEDKDNADSTFTGTKTQSVSAFLNFY